MKTKNTKQTQEPSLDAAPCSHCTSPESQEFLDAVNGPVKGSIFAANPLSAKKYMEEHAEEISQMESDLKNKMSHQKPYC